MAEQVAELPPQRTSCFDLDVLIAQGHKIPVGHDGFVRIVDYMGDDAAVVQAARVSYGAGTKKVREDRGLIRYLMRHRHCYHPSMQVLTRDGWKRWDECDYVEWFAVPDPTSRTLRFEQLPLEVFDADEKLQVFENERMSYRVTCDHRMWFKGKYQEEFEVVRAQDMQKWGHFDPMAGYKLANVVLTDNERSYQLGQLVGFALGDGSWTGNGLTFHLKKDRKQQYLTKILAALEVTPTIRTSATYVDAVVVYVSAADVLALGLNKYMTIGQRSSEKALNLPDPTHDVALSLGVLDGLMNSDGHVREDRNERVEFSSTSTALLSSFETLAALFGYDAHRCAKEGVVTAFPAGRTSLEARKQYFSTEHYTGKVYCTTTSTGLLLVRGDSTKFAFVCGNTTPFEMCELKLHVRVPMHIWRQWIRHRTASVNEYSTRYSVAIDSMEKTLPDAWRSQSKKNKQGSGAHLDLMVGEKLTKEEGKFHKAARDLYEARLEAGVAREQARKDLPLSTYTEAYWKIDLHNLLHFLSLRLHEHAQKEIREFGEAIKFYVEKWVPLVYEAFCDYRLGGTYLSVAEMSVLTTWMHSNDGRPLNETIQDAASMGTLSKREIVEFKAKMGVEDV